MKRTQQASQHQYDLFAEANEILETSSNKVARCTHKSLRHTVFAQRRIQPNSVARVAETAKSLGTHEDVQRFVKAAAARLNAPLETGHNNRYRFCHNTARNLRQRLADEGIEQPLVLDFNEMHRSHPLVSVLADHLIEESLQRG